VTPPPPGPVPPGPVPPPLQGPALQSPASRGLARKRQVARLVLWWEQGWPAAWPALGVLGLYAVLALLDVPAMLPPWPRLLLLLVAAAGVLALLWRGWRAMRRPTAEGADRRLERDTGLRHRPLAALADQPAVATAEGAALWQAHLARLATQVARLRVAPPRPGLPGRDTRALRGGLAVALLAGLVIAGPDAASRLLRGVAPELPEEPPAPAPVTQAWITPPAYTGLPPIFLHPGQAAVPVPTGSHLTVSVTGGSGEPVLALDGDTTAFRALDAGSWQAERDLTSGGTLSVQRRGGTQSWTLNLIPDLPPTALFTDTPGPAVSGSRPTQQTRLPWGATDDYGLASAQVELRLRERPEAPPLVVRLPLSGSPKAAQGTSVQDLSAHPWAGLAVQGQVVARDKPGQAGRSAAAGFTLPERAFENPVARAVLDVRRQLSLTPGEREPARMTLDALADVPEAFNGDPAVLLNLRAIASLLRRGKDADVVDEAQARMWQLALALEEGLVDRTAKALEAARQALRDAAEAKPETPAEQAELMKRMEDLREAIQKHMEALAEQARREGADAPPDLGPSMTPRDLDRMAQRMEQAAKEGRMDDAKQQMAELEKLLQQLQNARPEHGQSRDKQNAERRERGQQQVGAVQDIVGREGGLLDHAQGRPGGEAHRPPTPADATARQGDGRSQKALRRALGELMQRFGDLTGQVPPPLGEADTAMRDAAQALTDGHDQAAGDAEQRAIEALQKGASEMSQQLATRFGTGEQPGDGQQGEGENEGEGEGNGQGKPGGKNHGKYGQRDGQGDPSQPNDGTGGDRRRSARRDPLGRLAPHGLAGDPGNDVQVPDAMEEARSRAIQDELRRRGADRTRPQPELDYIDRLLKSY
jgi:uncharacterized protein (TIGR02302 family)